MSRHRRLEQLRHKRRRLCSAFFLILACFYKNRCTDRSVWIKHWIARRQMHGVHHNLFLELQLEDPLKYRRCLRMSVEMFENLLQKVSPLISKQDTHLRKSVPPAERLSVTLRHLATGESQESLSMTFRLGQSTISSIIKETCVAIYSVLKEDNLRFPQTHEEWMNVAHDYCVRWDFPNCLGAMDGKHFVIEPPVKSGSLYFNYKETFSVVLLAVVDAQLRFIYVDVGTNDRVSDRGIWNRCTLKTYLENLKIPQAPAPGTNDLFPFVIVGDEGFTLSEKVLLPYPKALVRGRLDRRIFNYRLSRARRCSENAFGVLANRFQIFRAPMRYDPESANNIILATCCLHNWLRSDTVGRAMYTPAACIDAEDVVEGTVRPGDWRNDVGRGMVRLANQGGNRHAGGPLEVRDRFCAYFNGVGAVHWQNRMVTVPD